jgi:c-di-GMP-binding flagellar brake protein YcgR
MKNERRAVLEKLAKDYGDAAQRARFTLTITPGEGAQAYSVWVLGVVRDKRHLIVTAPTTANNALIAVIKGQSLTCRWLNPTTAFRFKATILKLAFEPIALLYLELPADIERKIARRLPRALMNLHAIMRRPEPLEALVLDLSVGGARLAFTREETVTLQQHFQLNIRPRMLDRSFLLTVECVVTNVMGATDSTHPEVQFIGVEFRDVSEHDLLILHACVQEQLAHEADWLTHVLS